MHWRTFYGANVVFESRGNYRNTKFPNPKYCLDTVVSGKSRLEIRGFAKHIENGESDVTTRKAILWVIFFFFFFFF